MREGRLQGPRGTSWLPPCDLAEAAIANWREADFALERNVIEASLVSAYINDGWKSQRTSIFRKQTSGGDLDARRRRQSAQIVQRLVAKAIHGDDGSVAWIAPVLGITGWAVQPLQQDLYNGISGVALLLAAYIRETLSGRADQVSGADELFRAALHRLHSTGATRRLPRTGLADLDLPCSSGVELGWGRCRAPRLQTRRGNPGSSRSR